MMRVAPFCLLLVGGLVSASDATTDRRIERLIDGMTPRQRVAQLLVVGFTGTRINPEIRGLVADWGVGAVAIYSRNINSAEQLRELTAQICALAPDPPPLIAVDQEGGEVSRIAEGVPELPGQMALGATRSTDLAHRAGRALGSRLRRLGVTLNLAPVVDVADPASPIGIRAFARDAALTGELAAAFIRGQHEGGVASTAKHFPGVGVATADSHDELPVLAGALDLAPFRAAIDAGVDAIMIGHVAVPSIDGPTPATLSGKIVSMLRDGLHFRGLVITDALEMRALDRHEGIGRLAVRSVTAGADLVLVLWHERDREDVLAALEQAYASGELSDARVRQSLRRILRAKLAIPASSAVPGDPLIADDIAAASLTLLRAQPDLVPLRAAGTVVYIGPAGPIADAVHAHASVALPSSIPDETSAIWEARARAAAGGASVIVGAAQNRGQMAVIRAAQEAYPSARIVLISLASPQLIDQLPEAAAYLCTYGYLRPSQRATAAVLRGTADARGRLPVNVPGFFIAGEGIIKKRIQ